MNLAGKEDATVFKAFHTIQMRLQKDSNSIIYPYVKKNFLRLSLILNSYEKVKQYVILDILIE